MCTSIYRERDGENKKKKFLPLFDKHTLDLWNVCETGVRDGAAYQPQTPAADHCV